MNASPSGKPVVLIIAGHDPSGGAGLQADIEAVASTGCQAVSVVTSLTAQNTTRVSDVYHQEPARFKEQLEVLLEDIPVHTCKIGLVADLKLLDVIVDTLAGSLKYTPLVVDPVITAGSGHVFIDPEIRAAIHDRLLPPAAVVTPNSIEARELSGRNDLDEAGKELIDNGAGAVLITGSHEQSDKIVNRLYRNNRDSLSYFWERLPGDFHGSGCTLSSSVAAHLALGESIESAIEKAQTYTWHALKHGRWYGRRQKHPDRLFWLE